MRASTEEVRSYLRLVVIILAHLLGELIPRLRPNANTPRRATFSETAS